MVAMAVVALLTLAVVMPHPVDVNQANASFNEATGQQDRLPEDVPAIPVAGRCRLCGNVERTLGRGRREQIKGPRIVWVERLRGCAAFQKAGLPRDLIQK